MLNKISVGLMHAATSEIFPGLSDFKSDEQDIFFPENVRKIREMLLTCHQIFTRRT